MATLRYRCPYCGTRLTMISGGDELMVGCSKCGIYVIVNVDDALREVDSNVSSESIEKALARVMYKKYLMYSVKAMAVRESAKSINNSPQGR
ncbi:MAG: hypothetical protein GU355_06260 [Caldivirga sp.]|nr:hypothetical protein [Caldivirga sp.]